MTEIVKAGFERATRGLGAPGPARGRVLLRLAAATHQIAPEAGRRSRTAGRSRCCPTLTIESQVLPEYYWTREWLIVDGGDDLYLISCSWPTTTTGRPTTAISTWLDRLRIVRS
ncbi:MAG: hypothetical protein R3C32_11985 [Chloroflexota bacterium]